MNREQRILIVVGLSFIAVGCCPPFCLHPTTPDPNAICRIDAAAADAVIAWEDDRNTNGVYQIRARLMKRDGTFVGPDFTVNQQSKGQQIWPQAAMSANGDFVITWMDRRSGNYQVYVRGFHADGTSKFDEFRVNTGGTSSWLWHPTVSMSCAGDFVVAWADSRAAHSAVYMRGFYEDGSQRFPETKLSPDDGLEHVMPVVGVSPYNAHVVIAWQGGSGDRTADEDWRGGIETWNWHMWAKLLVRGFTLDGNAVFPQRYVNDTQPNGQEFQASISVNGRGESVVAWDNFNAQIRAAAFDASGNPFGPPIVVRPHATRRWCGRPEVALSDVSAFLITWEESDDGGSNYDIRAGRYNVLGQPSSYPYSLGPVNSNTAGFQLNPDIAAHVLLENHFVVWQDDADKNGKYEIMVRGLRLSPNQPGFSDRIVNSDSRGQQVRPSVAYRTTLSLK
jgi:hypothetical protein